MFTTVLLPIAVALIVASIGLALVPDDFRRVFTAPRAVFIGLANLVVLSPLLAFCVGELYGLSAAFAVGLVLLGASPGGTMANLLTHLARGNTALSITMTAVSSVCAAITVPLFLKLAVDWFDAADALAEDIHMAGVVARVFFVSVVPLMAGMYVRARWPAWAIEHEPRAKKIAFGIFLVVVIGAVASEWERATDHLGELIGAALTLNVLAMGGSYLIARLSRLDDPSATAISLELGLHNSALAIAVGGSIATVLTIPAAVYSGFMFLTAGAFARLMYLRNVRRGATAQPVAAEPVRLPA